MEDVGIQLLNDEEIIAEIQHSPKEDDNEGKNDSQVKIGNNDVFEFLKRHCLNGTTITV